MQCDYSKEISKYNYEYCQNEVGFQIILENPTRCKFVCKYHKNKITKKLKETGVPFTLNKLEACSHGLDYCTTQVG